LILIPCDIIYFPFENSHKACGRFLYCGPSGAGHFVKMIHNGIEYGVMQAYAEGFDILRGAGSDVLPDGNRYDSMQPILPIFGSWKRRRFLAS
jgi:6-phosphogluconate dehydrogenase